MLVLQLSLGRLRPQSWNRRNSNYNHFIIIIIMLRRWKLEKSAPPTWWWFPTKTGDFKLCTTGPGTIDILPEPEHMVTIIFNHCYMALAQCCQWVWLWAVQRRQANCMLSYHLLCSVMLRPQARSNQKISTVTSDKPDLKVGFTVEHTPMTNVHCTMYPDMHSSDSSQDGNASTRVTVCCPM